MIEPTDEMLYAFAGEPEITATDAHAIRVGLVAVLAIVERDYRITCPAEFDHERGTTRCVKDAGHTGGHRGEHPSAGVFWS